MSDLGGAVRVKDEGLKLPPEDGSGEELLLEGGEEGDENPGERGWLR